MVQTMSQETGFMGNATINAMSPAQLTQLVRTRAGGPVR